MCDTLGPRVYIQRPKLPARSPLRRPSTSLRVWMYRSVLSSLRFLITSQCDKRGFNSDPGWYGYRRCIDVNTCAGLDRSRQTQLISTTHCSVSVMPGAKEHSRTHQPQKVRQSRLWRVRLIGQSSSDSRASSRCSGQTFTHPAPSAAVEEGVVFLLTGSNFPTSITLIRRPPPFWQLEHEQHVAR
jgi:hypothetical protein